MMPINEDLTINENMNNFRRASRELFNNYFRPTDGDNYQASLELESFRRVEIVLFEQLVAEPSSIESIQYRDVQPEIQVVCRLNTSMPAFINRDIDSGYWDYPVKELGEDSTQHFVEFFDFESPGICLDNQFVKVKIVAHATRHDLIGKLALFNSFYVAFKKVR